MNRLLHVNIYSRCFNSALKRFEHKMPCCVNSKLSLRHSHSNTQKEIINKDENWVAVYRYPGVRFAVLLARAKLIQTIASMSYLPYSTYQFMTNQIDSTWYYTCTSLAIFAPTMLLIFSRYLNRLIGVIAMNENNNKVRIGYLTFWGSRKNISLDINDIVPLSEMQNANKSKMVKFMWFGSGSKFLYLPIKHAEILDEERAELLFGSTKLFENVNSN